MRLIVTGLVTATLLGSGMCSIAAAKGGGAPRMALSADGHTAVVTDRQSILVYQIGTTAQVVQ